MRLDRQPHRLHEAAEMRVGGDGGVMASIAEPARTPPVPGVHRFGNSKCFRTVAPGDCEALGIEAAHAPGKVSGPRPGPKLMAQVDR